MEHNNYNNKEMKRYIKKQYGKRKRDRKIWKKWLLINYYTFFSTTKTECPALARHKAVVLPAIPAPNITKSYSFIILLLLLLLCCGYNENACSVFNFFFSKILWPVFIFFINLSFHLFSELCFNYFISKFSIIPSFLYHFFHFGSILF